jgi:hypothetical protein
MFNVLVFGAGIILGMMTNNIYRDIRDFSSIDDD